MTAFYQDVIGLLARNGDGDRVELGTARQTLLVLQHLPDGRFLPHAPGLYHIALRVPERRDLAHWLQRRVEADTPYLQGASHHGVSEALYLSDPERNGIEIYRDLPQHAWPVNDDGGYALVTNRLNVTALLEEAPETDWTGLPAATEMGHVHLKVSDLEAARAFYVDLLGFDIKSEMRDSALFVAAGSYHHHIGLNVWHSRGADPAPPDAYGLAEFSVVLPDPAARERVLEQLDAADYHYTNENGHPLVLDPAGNALRLIV
jgi:catechol 2,3-dioxygenase